MKRLIVAYAGAALGMVVADAVWLTTMYERLYRPNLGPLLADDVRAGPAAAFYALYLFGVTYFAISPALAFGDWRKAALNGALLGVVAYGTYDLTNQATLITWPPLVTMLDLAWGSSLTAFSALCGYRAAHLITARP